VKDVSGTTILSEREAPPSASTAAPRRACPAAGEHGAWCFALSAAAAGIVAAPEPGFAVALAAGAVALAIPARREVLRRRLPGPWTAACAVLWLGALAFAPASSAALLGVLLVAAAALGLAHVLASTRLGARDPRLEVMGGALATLAAPVVLVAGGERRPAPLLALGLFLAAHAALRVAATRRALAARRPRARREDPAAPRRALLADLVGSIALAAATLAAGAMGAAPAPAALAALPGPLAALVTPRTPGPRTIGVREGVATALAALVAGAAVRAAG
jgi:hypothetical protein